jgi:hypothetical protein
MEIKIFLCPFNPYHKLYDNRKYQFHMARCKDRRGQSLYHCQYFHMHIFTKIETLLQHEITCDRRPIKSDISLDLLNRHTLDNKERFPSATYCKYNYEHVFKTLADRELHEKSCPNRQEFEQKINISQ